MKKVLTKILAAALGVAMIGSMAYVPPVEKSSDTQLRLVSIKAVDAQAGITGVRAYSDLVDTTKGYQVNDPVYLATTIEVCNLENSKYTTLKSIEDKKFKTVVGSDNIDLQFAKYSTPILLSHIYSGINDTAIGTIANILNVSQVLEYDKDKNEISFTVKGYQQNDASVLTGLSSSYTNQIFLAATLSKDGKEIMIPALRAKNGKTTITLGNGTAQQYTYEWTAPESMAYTMVITGITKDNAGAAEGSYYAKIQISGAEKFADAGYYYADFNGKAFKDLKIEFPNETPVEWVDYIKVPVYKLELKNAYDVYKYEVLASGMIDAAVEIPYAGANKEYLNADKSGKILAHVNPDLFDNTTKYDDAMESIETAGGVNTVTAVVDYKMSADNKTITDIKTAKVPLSSVVYTSNHTVYAPAYYGVIASREVQYGTAYVDSFNKGTYSNTESKEFVKEWKFRMKFNAAPAAANFHVTVIDVFTGKLVAGHIQDFGAVGTGVPQYDVKWEPDTVGGSEGYLRVIPRSSNVYPINSVAASSGQQSWYVHIGTPLKDGNAVTPGSPSATTVGFADTFQAGQTVDAIFVAGYATPGAYIEQPNYTEVVLDAALDGISTTSNATPPTLGVHSTAGDYNTTLFPTYGLGTTSTGWTGNPLDTSAYRGFVSSQYLNGSLTGGSTRGSLKNTLVPASLEGKLTTVADLVWADMDSYEATEITDTADVALVSQGLRMTLAKEWVTETKNGVSLERPGTTKVDLSKLPNFKITGVSADWTTNQLFFPHGQSISVTGFAQDYKDIEKAIVQDDGLYVSLTKPVVSDFSDTTVITSAADRITPDNANNSPTYSGGYSGAFITNSTESAVDRTAGTALQNPPYTQNVTVANAVGGTNIAFRNAGWAQTNTLPNFTASNSSTVTSTNMGRGLLNARIRIDYQYGGGKYTQKADPMSKYIGIVDNGDAHNGINAYVIQYNSDEQPIVVVASENTYYTSTDGQSAALFDALNLDKLARRIFRSQNDNLTYAVGSGYVNKSSDVISALKFFGLDTSLNTGYKVTDDIFENKGAAAVYSDDVTGTFKYGNLILVDDQVDDQTDENVIDDGDVDVEDGGDDVIPDDTTDETPAPAPKTADLSANVAIALTVSAIVAAAGLVFVLKKAR